MGLHIVSHEGELSVVCTEIGEGEDISSVVEIPLDMTRPDIRAFASLLELSVETYGSLRESGIEKLLTTILREGIRLGRR